mmetsp:Transcript_9941/g.21498  ORF Transcript_9941/g.21498 Transcript_9941/m.21498 type:complete len:385 (-) Transcript_9941:284-1438(-)
MQTPRALVSDQVGKHAKRTGFAQHRIVGGRDQREDFERPRFDEGDDLPHESQLFRSEGDVRRVGRMLRLEDEVVVLVARVRPLFVRELQHPRVDLIDNAIRDEARRRRTDGSEGLLHRLLQFVETSASHHAEANVARVVLLGPKLDQGVSGRRSAAEEVHAILLALFFFQAGIPSVRQRVVIPASKLRKRVVVAGAVLEQLETPPVVRRPTIQILRIHRPQFPLQHRLIEQRRDKELGKSIQRPRQRRRRRPLHLPLLLERTHVKVIIGILHIGIRIAHPAEPPEVILVLLLLRILLRSQEQHVLVKVSQAGAIGRIVEVAGANVHRGGFDVGGGIGGEEDFELIGELDDAVGSFFGEGFDELIVGGEYFGFRCGGCGGGGGWW